MKRLLDENLPKRLRLDFPEHEVYTVRDRGWNGIKNGELLKQMLAEGFSVLLTFDKNLQHQQNFLLYPIAVIVLVASDNTYATLTRLSPQLRILLAANLVTGPMVVSA